MLANLFYELLFAVPFLLFLDLIIALIRAKATSAYQKQESSSKITDFFLLFKVMHRKKLYVDTLSFRFEVH